MPTDIKLKNSVTATNTPTSLQQGEVAINVTDRKVWVGNAATTPVQLLGAGATGSFSALSCTTLTASGVATFSAGTVSDPAITTTGDTNTGIFFPAADTIAFTEDGAESMRMTSAGRIGIGLTNPATKFHVSGSSVIATFNSSDNSNVIAVSSASTVGGYVGATGTNLILANNNGTQALKIDTNSNLFFNSGYGSVGLAFACRAWVNFNGTTNVGGFCTIRASGNVTSVADNGTGDYTVNFTNAMPDANYSTQVTTEENTGANSNLNAGLYSGGTYSTTAVRVYIQLGGVGGFDRSKVCVSVFR